MNHQLFLLPLIIFTINTNVHASQDPLADCAKQIVNARAKNQVNKPVKSVADYAIWESETQKFIDTINIFDKDLAQKLQGDFNGKKITIDTTELEKTGISPEFKDEYDQFIQILDQFKASYAITENQQEAFEVVEETIKKAIKTPKRKKRIKKVKLSVSGKKKKKEEIIEIPLLTFDENDEQEIKAIGFEKESKSVTTFLKELIKAKKYIISATKDNDNGGEKEITQLDKKKKISINKFAKSAFSELKKIEKNIENSRSKISKIAKTEIKELLQDVSYNKAFKEEVDIDKICSYASNAIDNVSQVSNDDLEKLVVFVQEKLNIIKDETEAELMFWGS